MIAFTFPGQGSQTPGVGAPWVDDPAWALVERASAAAGRDVGRLLLEADAEELRSTDNAQLSTYVASLLVLDAVRRAGVEPAFTAGHSLGEYTALTAAGVLDLDDGVRLVDERGRAMLEAAATKPGTMAAVLGAEDAEVEAACAEARQDGFDVWVANLNTPGQVVVAGSPEGIERAGAAAKARGAKRTMAVAVSGAFHTPYMAPAQGRLDAALGAARFGDALIPTAANVDGGLHQGHAEWAALAARQLCSPVRWADGLRTLAAAGATTFLELGPGTVLSGMAKRTVTGAAIASAAAPADLAKLLATVESAGS